VTSALIQDMNALSVMPVNEVTGSVASAMPVTSYATDSSPPLLLNCSLNMQDHELVLSFSETIDASTLAVDSLTVQQHASASGAAYTLTSLSGTGAKAVAAGDRPTVIVDLSVTDMNAIKKLASSGLALNASSTYCSHTRGLINDVFGRRVLARANSDALLAENYTPDTTAPNLVSFDLNMNEYITENHVAVASASLLFVFDETIDLSTYRADHVTLQGAPNATGDSLQLSGSFETVTTHDGTSIAFTLLRNDTNAIKAIEALATSGSNTFVVLPETMVTDMYGNALTPVVPDQARQVKVFEEDKTAPQLLRFSIDMNDGYLDFVFDETVKGASIMPNELTIRDTSDPTLQTVNYTLTGASGQNSALWTYIPDTDTFPHEDSTVIRVVFTKADRDEIKRLNLCTAVHAGNDCFLVHTEFAVNDMRGNKIERCT